MAERGADADRLASGDMPRRDVEDQHRRHDQRAEDGRCARAATTTNSAADEPPGERERLFAGAGQGADPDAEPGDVERLRRERQPRAPPAGELQAPIGGRQHVPMTDRASPLMP